MATSSLARLPQPDQPTFLRWTLLATPLLDELVWGFPVLALPVLRDDLGLSYMEAGLLFTVGEATSLLLEPLLNLLGDRGSKRPIVLGGMLGLAAGFALIASATSLAWLLLAFALLYPASGAAVGLAQAMLVDDDPERASRTLTRWTFLASIGDLLGPPTVATVLALGIGWRPLFWLAAGLWAGAALILCRRRFPADARTAPMPEETTPSVRRSLHAAVSNRPLLRWIAVVLLASWLDEIFLGFAALYLAEQRGLDAATVSLLLGAQLAGTILGLVALDRVLERIGSERLLRGLALVALAGIAGLLLAPAAWLAALALLVLGLGSAGWYPLAQAGAYGALPGRTGTVRSLTLILGAPLSIGLPVVVGLAAEMGGITAGIAFLGLAPLLVLVMAPSPPSSGRRLAVG